MSERKRMMTGRDNTRDKEPYEINQHTNKGIRVTHLTSVCGLTPSLPLKKKED